MGDGWRGRGYGRRAGYISGAIIRRDQKYLRRLNL